MFTHRTHLFTRYCFRYNVFIVDALMYICEDKIQLF